MFVRGRVTRPLHLNLLRVVLKTHYVIPTLPLSWIATEAEESQSLNMEGNTKYEIPPTPSDHC